MIKNFNDFINEQKSVSKFGPVYTVAGVKFDSLNNVPTWFALDKKHSDDGWFKNMIENFGTAYQYEATIIGKIDHVYSEEVSKVLEENGIDPDEWMTMLVGNPSPNEVLSDAGTQILLKNGWSGIIYPDYDPRDWSKDLDALIVFNPSESVKDFKLVDSYPKENK